MKQQTPERTVPGFSVSKKFFRPAVRFPEHSRNVLETCLIEREGGFLPPSHFPRCSFTEVFIIVYRQSQPRNIQFRGFVYFTFSTVLPVCSWMNVRNASTVPPVRLRLS